MLKIEAVERPSKYYLAKENQKKMLGNHISLSTLELNKTNLEAVLLKHSNEYRFYVPYLYQLIVDLKYLCCIQLNE